MEHKNFTSNLRAVSSSAPVRKNVVTKSIAHYKIYRTLGSGASCKVKLGMDQKSMRKVAVKILNRAMRDKELEFVKEEVAALKKIKKHKHVVQLIDEGNDMYKKSGKKAEPVNYIVLELCTGG